MLNRPGSTGVRHVLGRILDEAMTVGPALVGSVRVVNLEHDALELVVLRGADPDLMDTYRFIHRQENCAVARAWRLGHRVTMASLEQDPAHASYLPDARKAGVQGVQCTPIIGASGNTIGMLTTFFRETQQPSLAEGVLLNYHAGKAAAAIDAFFGQAAA